ncbi:hypothetical protein O181_022591 [Austropuccinia psidii MF-1]|uniref:Reverse transcriptase Ty1/copia-type domain-containing protein n=1 Tax=Austropuccinia psidii MF-1 TaxID=1389203 RepID=A0A9Q3GWU5_9BASI|nr:hypothetical protein [Austropuccinia psidii MF-1]
MKELKLWEVVTITAETKLIGTTWVFKTKENAQNEILEHKARLCAQGFLQTPGIDFQKTFAPTGCLNSLRTLISFAASKNLSFEQLDIKSAFLNASLDEEVHLTIPHGLNHDKQKSCLRLKKAIYGFRQAPQAWYNQLSTWLKTVGFKAAISDPCVFYCNNHSPVWLFIHVNDIGGFGRDLTTFKQEFNTKLLGQADLILGINIHQSNDHIGLSQEHYVNSILEIYGMSNCHPVATPLIPNEHLETQTQEEIFPTPLALSQFLEKPGIRQWNAFMHVLRYLKGTADVCIIYKKNVEEQAIAYSDTNWGNCRVTRRSVSGHLILFNKGLVIWKTKKQPTVSLSSAEAEYKALCNLESEVLWFQKFSNEVKLASTPQSMTVYKDNQGCIDTANSNCNVNSRRMKHVEIQLHFIREAIKNGKITLSYTPTTSILAEFLTKSVCKPAIIRAMTGLNLLRLGETGGVKISEHFSNRLN